MDVVYLLHLQSPVANHARHYVGYTKNLIKRVRRHRKGDGSKLLAHSRDFLIARVWMHQGRKFERQLHNYKKSKKLCPICSGQIAYNRMKGD